MFAKFVKTKWKSDLLTQSDGFGFATIVIMRETIESSMCDLWLRG